ncbi:hypothetical protein BDW22DRAFT_18363 [Trametopsis cervina]|nr:hypothetical protein BDW22DRAFT_18363 [Trametopsis cervina]
MIAKMTRSSQIRSQLYLPEPPSNSRSSRKTLRSNPSVTLTSSTTERSPYRYPRYDISGNGPYQDWDCNEDSFDSVFDPQDLAPQMPLSPFDILVGFDARGNVEVAPVNVSTVEPPRLSRKRRLSATEAYPAASKKARSVRSLPKPGARRHQAVSAPLPSTYVQAEDSTTIFDVDKFFADFAKELLPVPDLSSTNDGIEALGSVDCYFHDFSGLQETLTTVTPLCTVNVPVNTIGNTLTDAVTTFVSTETEPQPLTRHSQELDELFASITNSAAFAIPEFPELGNKAAAIDVPPSALALDTENMLQLPVVPTCDISLSPDDVASWAEDLFGSSEEPTLSPLFDVSQSASTHQFTPSSQGLLSQLSSSGASLLNIETNAFLTITSHSAYPNHTSKPTNTRTLNTYASPELPTSTPFSLDIYSYPYCISVCSARAQFHAFSLFQSGPRTH